MKSRLVISFCGVADRERKHLGKKASEIRGAWAPGWRIDRAFLGRLAFGSSPLRAPGRSIDRAFLGRLAFGPSPIGALGLGRLARGIELGPMVPTNPPFSCRGGQSSPVGKKDKLDRHCMGNSRQLMLFNGNFVTFLKMH